MPHCSTGDDGRFAKIFISKISMKTLIGKYPRVFVQALSMPVFLPQKNKLYL